MNTYRQVMVCMVTGLMLAVATPSFAQRGAGAKMRGDFGRGFWAGQSRSRQVYRAPEYSRSVPQVESTIVQASGSIGQTPLAVQSVLNTDVKAAVVNCECCNNCDACCS